MKLRGAGGADGRGDARKMCDDENYVMDHPQDCRSRGCLVIIVLRCLAAVSSTKHTQVACVNMPSVARCLATLAPPSVAAGGVSQLAVMVAVVGRFTQKSGSNTVQGVVV